MKILHVIPFVSEQYGGPSRAIFERCRSQIAQGVDAEIVTTYAPSEKGLVPRPDRIREVNGVKAKFFPGSLGTYRYSPTLAKWLDVFAADYDAVHIHSIFTHPTLAASRACLRAQIPYIIETQGILYPWCLNNIGKQKKRAYLKLFELNNLKNAARIHFTTEHEKHGCAFPFLRDRSYVLRLGIEPANGYAGRDVLDAAFRGCAGKKLLLCLARIHPIKGFEELLPAIAPILKNNADWVLVIGGSGKPEHVREVNSLIKSLELQKSVLLLGHVGGAVKQSFLQNAEAFVLSSYSENFGIAILEAMQQGLPVAVSDRIALKGEIEKHRAGIVFSLNKESISKSIDLLIGSAGLRAELGSNGRRYVAEDYSWDHVTSKQVDIYEEVILEHKRRRLFS